MFKDLVKYAKQWQRMEKSKMTKPSTKRIQANQEYLKFKYELLCQKFNDFNINK